MKLSWSNTLGKFYLMRKGFVTLITFVSIRLFGTEATWNQVWYETFTTTIHSDRDLSSACDLDLILREAKERYHRAEVRRAAILDKCKTLLTLASLLALLVSAQLTRAVFDPFSVRLLVFLAMVTLLNTIILIAVIFGVRGELTIEIEQREINLSSEDLKKCLINLYFKGKTEKDDQNNYLVEVYKVARFFFLTAVTTLVFAFALNLFLVDPDTLAKATARELKNDPSFIKAVSGH